VPLAKSVRLAVESHVTACPACAADLARHRDLTVALRVLSAEAQTWSASPQIAKRLRAGFEGHHATSVPSPAWEPQTGRWRYALAIAAVVALAAWIGSRAPRPPATPVTAASPAPAPAVATPPATAPSLAGLHSTARPAASPRRGSRQRAAPAPRVRSFEFVTLPTAVGLPDLESGSVVRIQVPVGALPGYGVNVISNGSKTTVEADVLVGQDGQPRAIRLVTAAEQMAANSRSKP
jgi:hypothetical protein